MKAEIVCIGTELLLGQTVNTNAAWLGQRLAGLGIDLYRVTVVGDNIARIVDALVDAWERADVLILTGGLGPTADDLTHEAVATFWGLPLREEPGVIRRLEDLFRERGLEMTPSNRKQALLPAGAEILPNPAGTAPGAIMRRGRHILLTFPGVPSEMQAMWEATASLLLAERAGDQVLHSVVLKFVGITESALAERVQDLLTGENPTVAPLVGRGEVTLRVTAKAASREQAAAMIAPVAAELQGRLGRYYYGRDDETLEQVVGEMLQRRGETLGVAESCTGGWLGQRITRVPGSSRYFHGGVISYADPVKMTLLEVPAAELEQHGAVSEPVARSMALGVRRVLDTTWGLSITGIAGPASDDSDKPVGLVYVATAGPNGVQVRELRLGERERDDIRWLSTQAALNLLRKQLADRNSTD